MGIVAFRSIGAAAFAADALVEALIFSTAAVDFVTLAGVALRAFAGFAEAVFAAARALVEPAAAAICLRDVFGWVAADFGTARAAFASAAFLSFVLARAGVLGLLPPDGALRAAAPLRFTDAAG